MFIRVRGRGTIKLGECNVDQHGSKVVLSFFLRVPTVSFHFNLPIGKSGNTIRKEGSEMKKPTLLRVLE